MMSPEVIRSMSAEAAAKAARQRKTPLIVEQDDLLLDDAHLRDYLGKLPFLGDYTPAGWKRESAREQATLDGMPKAQRYASLFVDMTGHGYEREPALTWREFVAAVRALGPGWGYGIADMGQFQCNVWVYRPAKAKEVKP